jgi:hypothetical protein
MTGGGKIVPRRDDSVARLRPVLAYLRSVNPRLPRAVWIFEAGGLANMFGTGIVLPFLIIYLHNVRGLSLTVAGIAAAANALASLPAGSAIAHEEPTAGAAAGGTG